MSDRIGTVKPTFASRISVINQFAHIADVKVGRVKATVGFTLSSACRVSTQNSPVKKPIFTK